MLNTVCTVPFVSLVFLKFWEPTKKSPPGLLQALSSDRWDVLLYILRIMLLVFYSVFFHLGWLHSSLNFGVLNPLFVLFFFIDMLILIQFPLVTLV